MRMPPFNQRRTCHAGTVRSPYLIFVMSGVCSFHAAGKCTRGIKCNFMHSTTTHEKKKSSSMLHSENNKLKSEPIQAKCNVVQSTTTHEKRKLPSVLHSKNKKLKLVPSFPFQVDAADHCETSLEAYQHLIPFLDLFAHSIGKSRSTLLIYDPYYCAGKMKSILAGFGFTHVYNECEDFYEKISSQTIPEFDLLVTNPPYSSTHMEKLLNFCVTFKKPYALLLPNFVYTKPYYAELKLKSFFLVPKLRYSYLPPKWVDGGSTALSKGKNKTAPFHSFWYCEFHEDDLIRDLEESMNSTKRDFSRPISLIRTVKDLPQEVRGEFDTLRRRPNARTRKRMKQNSKHKT